MYLPSCDHKNAKVVASATSVVTCCLDNLKDAVLTDTEFTDLAKRMAKVCLHGKLADARKSGKR